MVVADMRCRACGEVITVDRSRTVIIKVDPVTGQGSIMEGLHTVHECAPGTYAPPPPSQGDQR